MPITLDGTNGIGTPDLESTGPITGTTITGTTGTFSGNVTANGLSTELRPLVLATAVTASGTSVDFTGIPSWVKRITVAFAQLSTNGTSPLLIQIGTSSGVETTAYASSSAQMNPTVTISDSTAGFVLRSILATNNLSGTATISLFAPSANSWASSHAMRQDSGSVIVGGGVKSLAATLDRVRITTVGGTDTFDNGTINIMWE